MAALGMIEVYGFTTAIVVADAVAKCADVKIVAIDRNKPANADQCEVPLVMVVKFEGDPSAVQAAHDAGKREAEARGLFITSKINSGLSSDVEWFAHLSALGRDKLRNLPPKKDAQIAVTAPAAEAKAQPAKEEKPATVKKPAAPKKTTAKKKPTTKK